MRANIVIHNKLFCAAINRNVMEKNVLEKIFEKTKQIYIQFITFLLKLKKGSLHSCSLI